MQSNVMGLGGVAGPSLAANAGLQAALTPDPGVRNILQRSVGENVADLLKPIQLPATRTPSGGLPAISTGTIAVGKGPWQKYVNLAKGADRAGVHTQPAVLAFVGALGQRAGQRRTIGTGTNHNRMTVDNNVSDHWSGHAADIPASGAALRRLGYLALLQAGMNQAQAARARKTGGLYNVGRYQIIFATHQGGNHFNHLHIGVRR